MQKHLLVLFLGAMISVVSGAQSSFMGEYVPTDPQVWSFIKYSSLTPDNYTGTVRAEIPLYTYKDPDFEIPISLSYASNGYMPNIQANFVGLGWTLVGGGSVARRVNGMKDDGQAYHGTILYKGYYFFSVNNTNPDISYWQEHYKAPFGYAFNNNSYEAEPDLFFFSMPGHSGKFVINSTGGTATVFDTSGASGEYRVNLANLDKSFFESTISIITGDGYQYDFGGLGTGDNYILNQYVDDQNGSQSQTPIDINCDSWMISRILAPNGRQVVYEYEIDQDSLIDQTCHPLSNESQGGAYIEEFDWPSSYYSSGSLVYHSGRLIRSVPSPRLVSIKVLDKDGQTEVCLIQFTYESRTKEKLSFAGGMTMELKNPGRLGSITVIRNDQEQLWKCYLSYRYTGTNSNPGNRVLLLNEVRIPGLGKYSMEYYNQDEAFPMQGCTSIDHWGYWNNSTPSYAANNLIPQMSVNGTTNEETIIGVSRNPTPSVAISGMLKKLSYPTGGWTIFEYEGQTYSKRVEKDGTVQSKGIPILKEEVTDRTAGGLRLCRVTDYVDSGTSVSREYNYEDNSGRSSGILYRTPRYTMSYVLNYNYPNVNILSVSEKKSDYPAYVLDEQIVGYSRVVEKYDDDSRKQFRYLDYLDIPDDSQYDSVVYDITFSQHGDGVSSYSPNYLYQYLRETQSLSRCRGKLKEVETIDRAGNITEKVAFQYSLSSAKAKKVSCLRNDIDSMYVWHIYVGDCSVTSETRTIYGQSGNNPVSTILNYQYNTLGQLKKKELTTAGEVVYNENYLYVNDLSSRTTAQDTMISRGIVSPFIYRTKSVVRPGITGARLIEGTMRDYSLFLVANRQLPILSAESNAIVSPTTAYTSPLSLTWKLQMLVTDVDYYGRPMEIKDANGVYVTWFWGYGGLYPVCRIENCSISQLNAYAHSSFNRYTYGWSGMSDAEASVFRKIPGCRLTHWKYSPYVGVTELTDPSGRKNSYTYNVYGRLTGVTGPDGNRIVEYEYSVDKQ